MDRGGGIHRVTILFGGQKANGLGGDPGVLIESMTESADNPQDMNLSRGSEDDFQLDLAFDFEPAGFFGIGGARLGEDLGSGGRRRTRGACRDGGGSCGYGVSKAAAADLSVWGGR